MTDRRDLRDFVREAGFRSTSGAKDALVDVAERYLVDLFREVRKHVRPAFPIAGINEFRNAAKAIRARERVLKKGFEAGVRVNKNVLLWIGHTFN